MTVTSGYNVIVIIKKKGRKSTNHMGKAIDAKIPSDPSRKS